MTTVLITGAAGMLGHDLAEVFADLDPLLPTRDDLDITRSHDVSSALDGVDVVINAAAYTDVDGCETDVDKAMTINSDGPRLLADYAKRNCATLIQISTDYVFRGDAQTAYPEDAPTDPLSIYGKSKAAGEQAARTAHPTGTVVVRTAWLYGRHGKSFPRTLLSASPTTDQFHVVTDQVGQPTWSRDVATQIRHLVDHRIQSGIFHATNQGETTWWEFARTVFGHAGLDPHRILPTTSEQFQRPAPRPHWSVLGHGNWQRHGLPKPRSWEAAWEEAFPICFADIPGGN